MDGINKIDKIPGDDKLNVNDDQLTEKIIACAFKVHNALGCGFSQKVLRKHRLIDQFWRFC